jgi:hypothetical protein
MLGGNLAVTNPPYAFLFEKPALKNPEFPKKIGFGCSFRAIEIPHSTSRKTAQSLATTGQTSYS